MKSTRLSLYCTDNTVVVALVTDGSDDSWVIFFSYVSDLFISYVWNIYVSNLFMYETGIISYMWDFWAYVIYYNCAWIKDGM